VHIDTRQALLRAAKFIDLIVTQDDRLLHALEDAYTSTDPNGLATAAHNILQRAESITYRREE